MASENSSPSLQLPSGSETMSTLQGAINQINGQVEHLENENQVVDLLAVFHMRVRVISYTALL